MEATFAEMPLALFTTLESLGAGAFITLAAAVFLGKLPEDKQQRIDRFALLPLCLVLAGFGAAFFHLASPQNALAVITGLGTSPLTNEVAVGVLFAAVAIVYVALGFAGKLSAAARRGLLAALAVLAVVFGLFMGFAYLMDTIASWNSPLVPLQMLGFTLAGGAATAVFVIALADSIAPVASSFRTTAIVLLAAGAALGIGCLAMQTGAVAGMENALCSGAALADSAWSLIAGGAVALTLAVICAVAALLGKAPVALSGIATLLAFAAILCCRLAFYSLQLSVGL